MGEVIDISIPANRWLPRPHQQKLWDYLGRGGKRAVAIWHRRAGKDETCLHATALAALERPSNYWHMLPEFSQARKAIWESVNPHTGRRRIDEAFPHSIRESTRETDMHIRFVNGSTWQCVGSDSVTTGGGIGSSVAGIVFSEWALATPSAWAYYRPILDENRGWAVWISTPRGRNHLLSLFQHAQRTPGWFAELLTARDTKAVPHEALAEALKEYCALYGEDAGNAMFEQEMMCSFTAGVLGSFYVREMDAVRREGRVLDIEPLPGTPIHRAWDLGIGDDTSVWWFCAHGPQILILDHLAASGVGLEWWRDTIIARERERGWVHGTDYVPHDAKVKELGTGRTRVETMAGLGLKPVLVPWATMDDGINAARRTLPVCLFHPRCEEGGISALENYRREWDEEKKCFKPVAVHDWTSHPADSFRYLSLSWRPAPLRIVKPPKPEGWHIPPPEEMPRYRGGLRA